MFAALTMVKRLVDYAKKRGLQGEGIKTIVYGVGPMYLADICEAVDVLGDRFVQIHGQGECPVAISALSRTQVSDRAHTLCFEHIARFERPKLYSQLPELPKKIMAKC